MPSAVATTADVALVNLWNPHAVKPIWVRRVNSEQVAGGQQNRVGLARTSARGATPSATVTPDADNDFERLLAPESGAVIEFGTWGTNPTFAGPYLTRTIAVEIGNGMDWVFTTPIRVPAGTGLAVTATATSAGTIQDDVTYEWDE